MLRFLIIATAPLALVLALLTTTSLALNRLHTPHLISTQLTWCREHIICWMGIDTTTSLMQDAQLILNTAGYQLSIEQQGYYALHSNGEHCIVRLMPIANAPEQIGAIGVQCTELRVAEVMDALGTPDRVGFTCDGNFIFYYGYNLILNLGATLSPNQPVELMALSNVISGAYRRRWFGFALPWRYHEWFC
jgi:hypothetical protein